MIASDLTSVFLCCKYAIPYMLKQGGGCIINMSSISGIVGQTRRVGGAYNAAKGGVQLLTKCLALDFAKDKIRVNAICPAWIGTRPAQQYLDALGPIERQEIVGLHPLGRIGTPEDVAQAALFLASNETSWITGTSLVVDGGYLAGKE
jgi:NAD(P)-dependent dehydrogenase (short-subunit alcohol dehydrogenase family)